MWAEIEKQLASPFGRVKLRIDGYAVDLQVGAIAPRKQGICVFVDGYFRGEWMLIDRGTEEGKRFFPTVKKRVWSDKHLKLWKRIDDKAAYEKKRAQVTEFRRSYWTSVTLMRRHFQKHNTDIQLVSIGYAP